MFGRRSGISLNNLVNNQLLIGFLFQYANVHSITFFWLKTPSELTHWVIYISESRHYAVNMADLFKLLVRVLPCSLLSFLGLDFFGVGYNFLGVLFCYVVLLSLFLLSVVLFGRFVRLLGKHLSR